MVRVVHYKNVHFYLRTFVFRNLEIFISTFMILYGWSKRAEDAMHFGNSGRKIEAKKQKIEKEPE